MGLTKTKTTRHSLERLKTRLGVTNRRVAERMIKEASRYGKKVESFEDGPLKDFLQNKANAGKRVRVFKNTIFIFCKTSNRCLTCYPIPEEFL